MQEIEFKDVNVHAKANVFFDDKVVSHSIILSDGFKKSLGQIYSGSYHFNTEQAEKMEIIAGKCKVLVDGTEESLLYEMRECFEVSSNSGFSIEVSDGICEYICSFIS